MISCTTWSLLTNVTCVPGLTVRMRGLTPLEVIVMTELVGVGGGGGEPSTVAVTSLDAALCPHAFRECARMKYVPADSVAVNIVADEPVSLDAMFDAPDVEPSSTTYDVAVDAPVHARVTLVPLTVALSADGAAGTVHTA